jgi:S-DNA-T family DNA segregation ATPase FtsK/SpoIIIE
VPRDWAGAVADAVAERDQIISEAAALVAQAAKLLGQISRRDLVPDPRAVPSAHPVDAVVLDSLFKEASNACGRLGGADREYDALVRRQRRRQQEATSLWGRVADFFRDTFGWETRREQADELREAVDGLQREIDKHARRVEGAGGQLRTGLSWYCQNVADRLRRHGDEFSGLLALDPAAVLDWSDPDSARWVEAARTGRGHTPVLAPRLRVGRLDERVGDRLPRELKGEARDWLREAVVPFHAPAIVPFVGRNKTIVVEAPGQRSDEAVGLLQSLVCRALAVLGRQVKFTLLDPAGLGRAFPMQRFLPAARKPANDVATDLAAVLGDIRRINGEVLVTEGGLHELAPRQLDREPFDLVFVANFPKGYDRRAVETLLQICENGPRAGRYVFIHHNTDLQLPHGVEWERLENRYAIDLDRFRSADWADFEPDGPPPQALWEALADVVRESGKLREAFDWGEVVGIPSEADWWRERATDLISTPVGVRGAEDKVHVWFGKGDKGPCAHGLLAGQTGSGKSNFYHTLILGLAVRYPPDKLQLYLIDGKFGVEFEPYQTLPHARVVSLRSSPELARSVLDELYAEMERRNKQFRDRGVSDYTAFRGKHPDALPRLLLLVDEYDLLFDGDRDGLASERLGQLARQGRSAGIHMLLGKQTFGASGMLDQRNTFANFELHLSFKQNPDTIGGMTEFGRAGKELLRGCDGPGKFVMTPTGRDEDCVLGMAAKMDRDQLPRLVTALARRRGPAGGRKPVVFRGDQPPSVLDHQALRQRRAGQLRAESKDREGYARQDEAGPAGGLGLPRWQAAEHPLALWLGRRLTVHGQATAMLRRAPAENLILLAGDARTRAGVVGGTLVGLAALYRPAEIEVRVCYAGTDPDDPTIRAVELIVGAVLKPLGFAARVERDPARAEGEIDALSKELDARTAGSGRGRPGVLAVLIDPERMPALRRVGDPLTARAPRSDALRRLLADGPGCGLHVAVVAGGWLAFTQAFGKRQELPLFAHRVATQMSKDDSYDFLGDGEGSQLRADGGQLEAALYLNMTTNERRKFRPYAPLESPDELARLAGDLGRG